MIFSCVWFTISVLGTIIIFAFALGYWRRKRTELLFFVGITLALLVSVFDEDTAHALFSVFALYMFVRSVCSLNKEFGINKIKKFLCLDVTEVIKNDKD